MTLLELYLRLPWSITRTARRDDSMGDYIVLSIDELEGFAVAAPEAEIEEQFWPALELFLQSYVDDNEVPPLPARVNRARFMAALEERQIVEPVPQASGAPGIATLSFLENLSPSEPINSRDLAGAAV